MRAIVNTAVGGSDVLDLREVPSPNPGSYEIRVSVRASALNKADISQRKGAYAAPPGAVWNAPVYSARDGKYFYETGGWDTAPARNAVR